MGPLWKPLTIHWAVLLRLSAVLTEALDQATDAQEREDDQEDDDKDPQGAGEDLILLAAAVTTAFESLGAGEEDATFGCSLLEAGQEAEQQGEYEAGDPGVGHPGMGATELP